MAPESNLKVLNPADMDYFGRGKWENPRFWNRLGGMPDLRGKKVLDLGCGHGSLCVDMAKAGATRVVGVDLDPRRIEFAQRNLERNFPDLLGRVEFHLIDIAQLPEDGFDLMTSKDTFEHVMDLPAVLSAMHARLKPGGRLYAAIGPLWNSPFGDHDTVKKIIGINLPWAHRVLTARWVLHKVSQKIGRHLQSYRDLGLNMLSFREYREILFHAGFEVELFRPNNSRHPVLRAFALLAKVPFLTEYFTHNLYCILRKPTE
ncbi:MAG: class I SAM-dependent methyltransferase [Armatimonadota bacterium]